MGNAVSFFVKEIIIQILYFISFLFNPFFKFREAGKGVKKFPIVLLHGWCSKGLYLIYLKKRLENLGYSVYAPDFGYLVLNKIEFFSRQLEEFVEKNKIGKFIFIGHSLGGLIGLYYFERNKNKIAKFISIGSPFKGSSLAKYAGFFSESAKQMIPGSGFLRKLHKTRIRGDSFYTIGSTHDIAVPYESSQLENARHIKVEYIGHMSLAFSKRVFNEIEKAL